MGEGGKLEGKVFGVACMNPKVGWEVVGYGSCRWTAAVNYLDRDGLRVRKRVQVVLVKEGGIQKTC